MNIVVGRTRWIEQIYSDDIAPLPGEWRFVSTQEQLDEQISQSHAIKRIYFLHWSEKVPDSIVRGFECVNFHMTDLPYGRGGSPLQNLILSGKTDTFLTALQMDSTFDGGPIYLKQPLALHGTAEAIYARSMRLAAQMIADIEKRNLTPAAQTGEVTLFKRRVPAMSRLPDDCDMTSFYNFVRMLDADGYPRAFLEYGLLRMEFSRATLYSNHVVADARISSLDGTSQ